MQSTTNYSMNLVEGADLVNIPVQLNPNFQTIDQEMFANKQASIGTATEVVTGTVHAIVRANVDADVFRFTATGAWTAGDTMTLDGSGVTVHLTDGTAPSTGAYIIGAEVVAVVNGSLVTLISSNATIDPGVTSFNSRTGAVTPAASDYDASMIDYDNTLSGLTSTDVQGAIDELSPGTYQVIDTATTTTTLTIDITNYKEIVIARSNVANAIAYSKYITKDLLNLGYSFTLADEANQIIVATASAIGNTLSINISIITGTFIVFAR